MSVVTRGSIQVVAEAVGIAHLKDEIADALAPDVEYRLRDLVQEAIKFQKHGRRDALTTEDINYALRIRHCEPLYGFSSPDQPRFCRALTPGVFYLEDPELNLADLLAEALPMAPVNPSFTMHWLAINGAQPLAPQNHALDGTGAVGGTTRRKRQRQSMGSEGLHIAKHTLTAEEHTWLDRVTAAVQQHAPNDKGIVNPEATKILAASLRGVIHDPSTQPLSAHLAALVACEVNAALRCLPRLAAAMRLLSAMLRSLSLVIEPYLHQIIPAVITCLVGKWLCASPLEDHWGLRHRAAALMRVILARFRDKYEDLQPRVCKTLLDALSNGNKPLSTHYGALVGLYKLGPNVVHTLLMPKMPAYLDALGRQLDMPLAYATPSEYGAACKAGDGHTSEGAQDGASVVAESTARQLEVLCVRNAALHVCANHLYRYSGPILTQDHPATVSLVASYQERLSTATASEMSIESLPMLVATRYQVLQADFGQSLVSYAWHSDWARSDAPGLLYAML